MLKVAYAFSDTRTYMAMVVMPHL